MTNQIHEFKLNVYPRRLWITCGCSPSTLNDLFPEGDSQGNPFKELDPTSNAVVDTCRRFKPDIKGGVLIRFRSKKELTAENITHESTHAAMEIYRYIGATVDYDNQEPFSYLCGYIAKCCEQVRTGKFEE